jgi:hypothetical protein
VRESIWDLPTQINFRLPNYLSEQVGPIKTLSLLLYELLAILIVKLLKIFIHCDTLIFDGSGLCAKTTAHASAVKIKFNNSDLTNGFLA